MHVLSYVLLPLNLASPSHASRPNGQDQWMHPEVFLVVPASIGYAPQHWVFGPFPGLRINCRRFRQVYSDRPSCANEEWPACPQEFGKWPRGQGRSDKCFQRERGACCTEGP